MDLPVKFLDFLNHWRGLGGQSRRPTLSDFLDKPIPALQPCVSIFDVNGGKLVLRLLGTNMVRFAGIDFTGKTLDDFAAFDGRPDMRRPYMEIAQRPCGGVSSSLWETSTGRKVEVRSLGLPLFRKHGVSVAWLNDVTTPLGPAETGHILRRLVSTAGWIDLGYGVPA